MKQLSEKNEYLKELFGSITDCTWTDIDYISKIGEAKNVWNLGSQKNIGIDLGKTTITIPCTLLDYFEGGKESYLEADTNNPIGSLFCIVLTEKDINTIIQNTSGMDDSESYTMTLKTFANKDLLNCIGYGWESSKLREFLNTKVLDLLPKDLKNVIKEVKVRSLYGYDSNVYTTEDYLFTPSISDFGLNELPSPYITNNVLKYYENENYRFKGPCTKYDFLFRDHIGDKSNRNKNMLKFYYNNHITHQIEQVPMDHVTRDIVILFCV